MKLLLHIQNKSKPARAKENPFSWREAGFLFAKIYSNPPLPLPYPKGGVLNSLQLKVNLPAGR